MSLDKTYIYSLAPMEEAFGLLWPEYVCRSITHETNYSIHSLPKHVGTRIWSEFVEWIWI